MAVNMFYKPVRIFTHLKKVCFFFCRLYVPSAVDEHGQKIQEKAEKTGVTPQKYVDQVAAQVKDIWDMMNSSYDNFVRTTDKDHETQVKKIFKKLYEKGDIYKGAYEGMYCTPCESFWTESQLAD